MKYIVITDTHFGAKNNSLLWCASQLKYIDNVLIPYLNNQTEPWKLIHLGDVFDSRAVVNAKIVDEIDKRFEQFNEICERTGNEMIIVGGNHDYFSPENDNVSFLNILLRNYKHITVLTDKTMALPYGEGVDLFMPWYEFNDLENLKSKIFSAREKAGTVKRIFTHTDCNFPSEFREVLTNINVYAGHIHQPFNLNTWHNLGATFAKDMNDANRRPGAYIIDDGIVEILYNDESIRFWKYKGMPGEADILQWKADDIISIVLSRQNYEYNQDAIHDLKTKYNINTMVYSEQELTLDEGSLSVGIEEICRQNMPAEYAAMFEEVCSILKSQETE